MQRDVRNTEPGVKVGNIITLSSSGDFKKTYAFLRKIREKRIYDILDSYGQKGVQILSEATPVRTGKTAASWTYVKEVSDTSISLEWHNTNMANDGVTPVVILIIKGHGTKTGGYVAPNDFVSPLMESLYKEVSEAVWKVVTSL